MDHVRDLVDRITDTLMQFIPLEQQLSQILLTMDDKQLSQLAFYIEDRINGHPDLPDGVRTTMTRIETYIASRTRRAKWQADYAVLMDELDEINELRDDEQSDLFEFNNDILDEPIR